MGIVARGGVAFEASQSGSGQNLHSRLFNVGVYMLGWAVAFLLNGPHPLQIGEGLQYCAFLSYPNYNCICKRFQVSFLSMTGGWVSQTEPAHFAF
ncbi:hypothetical protein H6P81_006281 [Aristolochia fimbriata]|uniref:Uncharacterized protein n=1 Tax=Aristolochia fimbriata TaxID=158543 RepID=A0AAV7F0R9_ARIFI|nr:hypothetical protein H6P81_006281 [Aristolochia fimbriata]